MQRQQWSNNSHGTAGGRHAGRNLVGEVVPGCAPNASPARSKQDGQGLERFSRPVDTDFSRPIPAGPVYRPDLL